MNVEDKLRKFLGESISWWQEKEKKSLLKKDKLEADHMIKAYQNCHVAAFGGEIAKPGITSRHKFDANYDMDEHGYICRDCGRRAQDIKNIPHDRFCKNRE